MTGGVRLAAGLLVLALGACAGDPPMGEWPAFAPPAAVKPAALPAAAHAQAAAAPPTQTRLVLRRTPLARYVEIDGPKTQHAPPFLGVPQTNYFLLRSWLDRKTGKATTQLYVSDSYSGTERVWQAAHDGAGNPLTFVSILRKEITCENGCAWEEEFAATLPQGALAASAQGYAVTFGARSGASKTIFLSPRRMRSQLAALNAARARLVSVAAGNPAKP